MNCIAWMADHLVHKLSLSTAGTETATPTTPCLKSMLSDLLDSIDGEVDDGVMDRIDQLQEVEKKYHVLVDRVAELERREEVQRVVTPSSSSSKGVKIKTLTPEQRQIMQEVMHGMKSQVVRGVKFPVKGWNNYSTQSGTVCAMIMEHVSLPVGMTEDDKKDLWNGLIKKALPRMLTVCKNRITQPMREQFNGEKLYSMYVHQELL